METQKMTPLQLTHSRMRSANGLGKVEVKSPPTTTKTDPLRPLQTNTPVMRIEPKPPEQPKKYRPPKPDYQLVNEKDVPVYIQDYRRKVAYKKFDCIGSGAFARAFRVKAMDGTYYAAKVFSKQSLTDRKLREKLYAEINIHRVLKHEYIVKYHSCFEDKMNVYFILDYCPNSTLSALVKSRKILTENETRYYMGQIFSALRYMGDNRILHRDLKLSNVLLDEKMDCRLGDFGLSALLVNDEDRKRTVCGTPHYIAPEILFNKSGHDHRADMWSAGILMFNLLFGYHPFREDRENTLYQIVRKNENSTKSIFPTVAKQDVSLDARHLISSLLVNDPDARLSVIEALEHPFFTKYTIPIAIPKTAKFGIPTNQDLFSAPKNTTQPEQSKVAVAIKHARDRNASFIDDRVNAPLKLGNELIYDPRSQYPIVSSSSQPPLLKNGTIPTEKPGQSLSETTSKRRLIENKHEMSKRVCSDSELPKVESLKVTPELVDSRPFAVPLPPKNRKPIMEEMTGNLKIMMNRAVAIPKQARSQSIQESKDFEWNRDNIFVTNWVDCTSHYGFTYRLSDATLGALFNDGSTMTITDSKHFYYIYTRIEDNRYIEHVYQETGLPTDLLKKCAVLEKFKRYISQSPPLDGAVPAATETTKVHIFKYIVTAEGMAFRLNNGVIQFNFFDHTKLVLYNQGNQLIYIDKDKSLCRYSTLDVFCSTRQDIIDALQKAFDILEGQNQRRQDALRGLRWERIAKSTPSLLSST